MKILSLVLLMASVVFLAQSSRADTVTVDWTSTHQTIDGFGGSGVDYSGPFPTALADFFFTQSGIGLSIIRTEIIPNAADCANWCSHWEPCTCVASTGPTMFTGELQAVQQAVARGARVLATEWSPTGVYKSNGDLLTGGSLVGNSSNYAAIAKTMAAFPGFLAANGVSLYAIAPQNEPDQNQPYPSCLWTGQQFHDFMPFLHSALGAAGYSGVQVLFPENSAWSNTYRNFAETTMNDSAVASDVGIMAQHGYAGDSNIVSPSSTYGKHLWVTEDTSHFSNAYDGGMSDALSCAEVIHKYMTVANANAYLWWYLSNLPANGDETNNSGLTDASGNLALRAYVTGNWSKFVRPGWHRVGVTYSGSLLVSAFANSDGTNGAVVVVNGGSSAVSGQSFSAGAPLGASVVPWVTSSTQKLESQPAVPVSAGAWSYTIPAESVVTFAPPSSSSPSPVDGGVAEGGSPVQEGGGGGGSDDTTGSDSAPSAIDAAAPPNAGGEMAAEPRSGASSAGCGCRAVGPHSRELGFAWATGLGMLAPLVRRLRRAASRRA